MSIFISVTPSPPSDTDMESMDASPVAHTLPLALPAPRTAAPTCVEEPVDVEDVPNVVECTPRPCNLATATAPPPVAPAVPPVAGT